MPQGDQLSRSRLMEAVIFIASRVIEDNHSPSSLSLKTFERAMLLGKRVLFSSLLFFLFNVTAELQIHTQGHHVAQMLVSERQQWTVVNGSPDVPRRIVSLLESHLHHTEASAA